MSLLRIREGIPIPPRFSSEVMFVATTRNQASGSPAFRMEEHAEVGGRARRPDFAAVWAVSAILVEHDDRDIGVDGGLLDCLRDAGQEHIRRLSLLPALDQLPVIDDGRRALP